jgi:hypothetical protein
MWGGRPFQACLRADFAVLKPCLTSVTVTSNQFSGEIGVRPW